MLHLGIPDTRAFKFKIKMTFIVPYRGNDVGNIHIALAPDNIVVLLKSLQLLLICSADRMNALFVKSCFSICVSAYIFSQDWSEAIIFVVDGMPVIFHSNGTARRWVAPFPCS